MSHDHCPVPPDRQTLEETQLGKLRSVVKQVLSSNAFYRTKFSEVGLSDAATLVTMNDYQRLPFTSRAELSADQIAHPPYGTNITYELKQYTRIHQTSGTTGQRLRWLDTEASWDWWGHCWQQVFRGAGVSATDRVFFAFSFGPFIGFWSGFDSVHRLGALAIPGGGMSSEQRLDAIIENAATTLVCTPTYALHLAEVANGKGLDLAGDSSVQTTIHAGEPGAGLPATRRQLERAWGARCFDHAGATEVGAWGYSCSARDGLHLNEAEFICEVIDPESNLPALEGELVITNLGRAAMPVIRYRTGDRVTLTSQTCACGSSFRRLAEGLTGRIDDAFIVRGVILYPSSIENIVRQFPEVSEFGVEIHRRQNLDEIEVHIETPQQNSGAVVDRMATAMRHQLGLRADVSAVSPGSLPRFELKAQRVTDHRE